MDKKELLALIVELFKSDDLEIEVEVQTDYYTNETTTKTYLCVPKLDENKILIGQGEAWV